MFIIWDSLTTVITKLLGYTELRVYIDLQFFLSRLYFHIGRVCEAYKIVTLSSIMWVVQYMMFCALLILGSSLCRIGLVTEYILSTISLSSISKQMHPT